MAASEDDLFGEDDFDVAAFDAVLAKASATAQTSDSASGRTSRPVAGGSKQQFKQQTLFGAPAPLKAGSSKAVELGSSAAGLAQQQAKTRASKKWDRTKFAQGLPRTGGARGKGKGKAKASSWAAEDEEDDEVLDDDDEEADQAMLASLAAHTVGPPPAMKLRCDEREVKTWVYSANKPKRKYQYDIVHRALYNNCLVSLPTGLGKTFIAAVVMLNFYRWYPKGKVIFLAPTRPLVQQQIEACHSIAGIPSRDCVALTGMVPAPRRALAWASKRVVFSTPQTVENDLRRGRLDPLDVVCCVVDEAHRATGGYAYCEVVRILMQFNSHFRVLALTATPGNDAEKVQEVVDSLHIGHIEVRTEDAMDVKPYLRQKQIVLEQIGLTPELESIRDRWASLMRPLISQVDFLLYGTKEPAFLSYYSIQQMQGRVPKDKGWLRPTIAVLAKMTLAMARLLEYSITVGAERMADLRAEKSQAAKKVVDQQSYRDLIRDLEKMRSTPGYSAHPKMDKMKALILEYLTQASDAGKEPRLMVFCHFREVVDDIVTFLNQESPMIRASAFVGQSKDAKGRSGMNQKAQQACIKRFKANDFNVLVATSIGEEGLDIGALDCILCYDAQSSPLRTLQRIGRTGRLDDGKVIVLMAEGREERNWDKAKDKYEHVQNALISGKMFELFDDCERLVPPGVKPACDEREIPVQQYIADQVEIAETDRAAKKADKATKRKRDGVEDLPANALKGFTSAKNAKGPQSREESLAERAEAALLTAEEYEAHLASWGRSASLALAAPAIDLDAPLHGAVHVETSTRLGKAIKASRRPTPSARQAAIFQQAAEWTNDETKYDAWKSKVGELWDEDSVVWWANDTPGTGVRQPRQPCEETRNPLRRRFRKLQVPEPTPLAGLAKELWGDEEEASTSQAPAERESVSTGRAAPRPAKSDARSDKAVAKGPLSKAPPRSRSASSSPLPDVDVISHRVSPRKQTTAPEVVPDSLPASPEFLPRPTDPDNVMSSDSEIVIPRRDAPTTRTVSDNPPAVRSPSRKSGSVIEFDDTVDLSSGAVDLLDALERPGPAPKAPRDDDSFLVPLLPASKVVQLDDESSPMPLQKKRRGPPKVRDSYDPATQMPIAPGRAKRTVVQPESDEGDEGEGKDGDEEKKRAKKLRRAGASNGSPAKVEKTKKVRHGNDWAKTTGLFEIEASEASSSSDSDKPNAGRRRRRKKKKQGPSSSPSIPSEDSDDVRFVAHDDSSQSVDQSMHRFYIDSLATQAPALPHDGLGFNRGATRPGAGRWRETRAMHNVMDTPPQLGDGADAAQDDFEKGSFVCSDDEISWEEGASGAVDGGPGTSEL